MDTDTSDYWNHLSFWSRYLKSLSSDEQLKRPKLREVPLPAVDNPPFKHREPQILLDMLFLHYFQSSVKHLPQS